MALRCLIGLAFGAGGGWSESDVGSGEGLFLGRLVLGVLERGILNKLAEVGIQFWGRTGIEREKTRY